MIIDDALENRLVERVGMLGEILCVKSRYVAAGRAHAQRITERGLPEGTLDIVVSTHRALHFPKRTAYWEAINALLSTISPSRPVANKLRGILPCMLEGACGHVNTDEFLREGAFVFYAISRVDQITTSLAEVEAHISQHEFPLKTWSYLCHSVVEPEPFEEKTFVAVRDRVAKVPNTYDRAPCVSVARERIRLDSTPTSVLETPMYYMVGRKL